MDCPGSNSGSDFSSRKTLAKSIVSRYFLMHDTTYFKGYMKKCYYCYYSSVLLFSNMMFSLMSLYIIPLLSEF